MRLIVVPVSGGKDSQACLKLAIERNPGTKIVGLFCDTQFEHPLNYAHVDYIRFKYGIFIDYRTGGTVLQKSLKYKRFPGSGSRHCTDELKIRETRIYLKEIVESKQYTDIEVWYGMRSDESHDRKRRYKDRIEDDRYEPHVLFPGKYPKYLNKGGVWFKLPILTWTKDEVFEFLSTDVVNPLYKDFDRVGCFPCLASNPTNIRKAFAYDDFGQQQERKVIAIASVINKSPFGRGEAFNCTVCSI